MGVIGVYVPISRKRWGLGGQSKEERRKGRRVIGDAEFNDENGFSIGVIFFEISRGAMRAEHTKNIKIFNIGFTKLKIGNQGFSGVLSSMVMCKISYV